MTCSLERKNRRKPLTIYIAPKYDQVLTCNPSAIPPPTRTNFREIDATFVFDVLDLR